MEKKIFSPLYIRNFPVELKKQLAHLAIDLGQNRGIGKMIIKACKELIEKGKQ